MFATQGLPVPVQLATYAGSVAWTVTMSMPPPATVEAYCALLIVSVRLSSATYKSASPYVGSTVIWRGVVENGIE